MVFDSVRVPASNLLLPSEGKGFSQMMAQLPSERLMIAVAAVATAEQAVVITTKYAKDRIAFGGPLVELQNSRFKLAECKTVCHIGRIFLDKCIGDFIAAGSMPPTQQWRSRLERLDELLGVRKSS